MALLDEIGAYLGTNVGALTLGTNLHLSRMLETPDVAVALYNSTAAPPTFYFGGDGNPSLESPRLQVLVRHTSYTAGNTLAYTIWTELNQIVSMTLSGTRYLRCAAVDSPTFLERDRNDRPIFSTNYDILKEVS